MFHRALLPVDGSGPSLAAIEPAIQAVSPGGDILVCAVIPTIADLLGGTATSTRDSRAAMELAQLSHAARQKEAHEHLDEAARRIEVLGGRVSDRLVVEGEPGPQILRAASTSGCDVIVIATNGRSGWRRMILGSVADFVARNAEDVPILLVRRPRN